MIIELDEAVSELKAAQNILILCHANPDGDTLGSGTALLRALRAMGKKVEIACNDKISEKYSYLFEGIEEENTVHDFIVSVDVAERKLLGDKFNKAYGDTVDLSIDHHTSAKYFAKKTYCEPDSASTCEIIYEIVEKLGVAVTEEIASCIYTGMSTDTGCFRYSNVTPRTHMIAAKLIMAGAKHSEINTRMFETKSMSSIMLERMCLDSLESYENGKIAVITVTNEMLEKSGAERSNLDAIKPITRQIEGVEIGITVKQEANGKTGVSIRTSENYNAAEICAAFSGGGHNRAAGCEMSISVEEAKNKVIKYIIENVI